MNKRWKVLIPIIFVGVIIIILLLLKGCGKTKSADNKTTEEEMTEGEVQKAEHTAEDNGMTQTKPQATTQAQGMMQADKPETTEQGGTTQQTVVSDKPDAPTTEQPKPQTPNTTEAPAQPQTPPATTTEQTTTEQATTEPVAVWVVDQPAWDEEVPIYETHLRAVCYGCGGRFYTQEEMDTHVHTNGSHDYGSYDEAYDVQVGTETIHHDEIGHWEYR